MGKGEKVVVAILCLIVGFTFGWWIGYGHGHSQGVQEGQAIGYQQGLAACQVAAPAVSPVSLKIVQSGGDEFNLSAYISPTGNATNTTISLAITIENIDNEDAKIKITLVNPKTGEEGLPAELKNRYFNVFYGFGTYKIYLYNNGYKESKDIVVPANSVVTLNIGVELEDAPDNTFVDGQTYTMKVFIVQPEAGNYTEALTYTVLT